ncbi:hypothetical protein BCR36DRAFT_582658 [Piromyces finnis]|uniref:RING-type domain-containing protein n=1 Tax=Piromyces finnis TaxID=1754191 RepID=A0A1Y1VDN5_9FUNG|nr:hypothetical protein BCR36DRAFT_582658 [Piromyces finnis]|eukprot:ORX52163.1 hypothetical protein BCR36DRAFT_582658 [Piromyces finnis]
MDHINNENDDISEHNENHSQFIYGEDKKGLTFIKSSFSSSHSDVNSHFSFNPETSSSAEICAICIDQYELNDELRKLPCGHEFHKEVF